MRKALVVAFLLGAAGLGSTLVFGSGGSNGLTPTQTGAISSVLDYGTLTATGSTQATAAQITNHVTNITAGDTKGARLPTGATASTGDVYEVICSTASTPGTGITSGCLIYPAVGDTISPLSANANDIIPAQNAMRYRYKGGGLWAGEYLPLKSTSSHHVIGAIDIYGAAEFATTAQFDSTSTFTSAVSLTSQTSGATAATGNQGTGPVSTLSIQVTTVTSANDDITMPATAVGKLFIGCNAAAANALDVWPASGSQINKESVNTQITLAAGECMWCLGFSTTRWGCNIGSAN